MKFAKPFTTLFVCTLFFNPIMAQITLESDLLLKPNTSNIPGPAKVYDAEFSLSHNFPLNQIYCTDPGSEISCTPGGIKRNQIALTFDDGPNSNTREIIKVLRAYGVPATFFVTTGPRSFTQTHKRILDEMYADGHKISSHGQDHGLLAKSAGYDAIIASLLATDQVITPYQRRGDVLLYRNPGGFWSTGRAQTLNAHPRLYKYVGPIYWNVGGDNVTDRKGTLMDAADWRCRSLRIAPATCAVGYYNKIVANYNNNVGSLVLMHDIHTLTTDMLIQLLEWLKNDEVNWEFIFVQDIPAVQYHFTSV